MNFLSHWWRQPGRYPWLVAYLETRGAYQHVRLVVIVALVVGPSAPVLVLLSPSGPATALGRTVTLVAGLAGLSTIVLWLRRTPMNELTSKVFVVVLTLSMAVAAIGGTTPQYALAACAYFVMVTGYAAVFHSARVPAFVLAVVVVAVAILASRLTWDDPVISLWEIAYVVSIVIAVPVVLQWLLVQLRSDVITSDVDPLTGLINRRAIEVRIGEMVDTADELAHALVLLIIDLDRFKLVNDIHGHSAGDRALVAVADALRASAPPSAVLARLGGEEFLLAECVARTQDAVDVSERTRLAVVVTPPHLTASVGAVSCPLPTGKSRVAGTELQGLIDIADAAMYEAKRAGGDQCRVRRG